MYYLIKHLTRFRYSETVSEGLMEARMMPRSEGPQRCLSFDLVTSPKAQILEYTEHAGNVVTHFNIPRRHSSLVIQAQSAVEMNAVPRPEYHLGSAAWDEMDHAVAEGDFWELLVPSRFTESSELLANLAKELNVQRREDPYSLICELNTRLYTSLEYSPLTTKADSPIDEALKLRKGVCQDFAHILIALLRAIQIPARYVSGYLYRSEVSKHRQTEGATHAWVEAYLPHYGWVGFDPSNKMLAGEEHIRVALGRDYADVPPTKGVFKGHAESEVSVKVVVERLEHPPRPGFEAIVCEEEAASGQSLENGVDYILQSYRAHQLQQQQ